MNQSSLSVLPAKTIPKASLKMRKASLLRMMLPMPTFRWHSRTSAERSQVESYITGKFHQEYDANVSTFAPLLLSMHCKNNLNAAIGVRPAQAASLFIERYLDANIEDCIQSPDNEPVKREEVVEISNLAATRRGASQLLFIIVSRIMYEAGYRWIVFSATKKVERSIRRFPLAIQVLGASTKEHLGEFAQEWGRYYETSPRVIAGDIKAAYQKSQDHYLLKIALLFSRPLIRKLARKMSAVA